MDGAEERKKLVEQVEELQLQVGGLQKTGKSTDVPASVVKSETGRVGMSRCGQAG